jgi:hypothetical protein
MSAPERCSRRAALPTEKANGPNRSGDVRRMQTTSLRSACHRRTSWAFSSGVSHTSFSLPFTTSSYRRGMRESAAGRLSLKGTRSDLKSLRLYFRSVPRGAVKRRRGGRDALRCRPPFYHDRQYSHRSSWAAVLRPQFLGRSSWPIAMPCHRKRNPNSGFSINRFLSAKSQVRRSSRLGPLMGRAAARVVSHARQARSNPVARP